MENNNTITILNHKSHLPKQACIQSLKDDGLEKADWDKALETRFRNSNNFTGKQGESVSLWVDLDYFKQFGPGTYLFFIFAKRLAILFVILFLLAIPPIAFNIMGKGLDSVGAGSTKTALMQFSIANQPIHMTGMTREEYEKKIEAYKSAVVIPDIVYSIVFFLFVIHWQWTSAQTIEQLKKECDLPSYYTVKVKDLPLYSEPRDLRDFMNQFGQVIQVSEVKDYDQCIKISKQLYETESKIIEQKLQEKPNSNRVANLNANKISLFQQLQQDLERTKGKTQYCFVTFRFPAQRTSCLKKFAVQARKTKWCCRGQVLPNMLYFGTLLRVQPCNVEPSSIIWENMHLSTFSRVKKIILQTTLVLTVVFLAFVLILTLNALVPQTYTYSINTSGYQYADVIALNNKTITQSWCLNLHPQDIYGSGNIELKALCSKYYNQYFADIGISFAISLSVLIITLLLVLLVKSLSRFQRYKSYNQLCSSTIFNLLITNIFTTIIITMLLQAQLFGFSFKSLLGKIFKSGYVKQNLDNMRSYDDIKRQWYLDIGYKICLSWLIISVLPILINPLLDLLYEKVTEYRAKKQFLQKKMQSQLQKPQFQFEEYYANMLNVIFATFAFAGPMPLLILVAAIALIARYIYWKYYFLRFCRIPRIFDSSLNSKVMRLLPFALFIHMGISMYAYSRQDIFPLQSSITESAMNTANQLAAKAPIFIGRIIKAMAISWHIGILLSVLSGLWTIKFLLFNVIHRIYKKVSNADHKLPTELLARNQSFVYSGQKDFLSSYKIENNPDYNEIMSIMKAVSSQKRMGTPPLPPIQPSRISIEEMSGSPQTQIPIRSKNPRIFPILQETPRPSISIPLQPLLPLQAVYLPEVKTIIQPFGNS